MAITLLEAAKHAQGQNMTYKAGVMALFAQQSSILEVLPFENIPGNAFSYSIEESLPGVGFRGYNEGYVESTGIINPRTEVLAIAGGDLDVDKAILKHMGDQIRPQQEASKIKSLVGSVNRTFIKGDSQTNKKEFSGLQTRIVNNQLISAGSTANGAALSLAKLDELIDTVDMPTHLIMNKALGRRLAAAARDVDVAGYLTYGIGAFGQRVMAYNGIPILYVDKDNNYDDILPFGEAAASGTATATSIYCVSMTPDGVIGLQNGSMEVVDLGELEAKPSLRTRIEWSIGMAVLRGRAAARLNHIGNLAVVA